MFLSNEGKYYFDKTMKMEYTYEFHKEIKLILYGNPNLNIKPSSLYSKTIDDITYDFKKDFNEIIVSSALYTKASILRRHPIHIILENSLKRKHTIYIYTKEQFEIVLKHYNIKYPCANSMILTDEIIDIIFDSENEEHFEIDNLPLKDLYNKTNSENGTFEQLSKYIGLYMKSELDIKDFPEKNIFLNQILS